MTPKKNGNHDRQHPDRAADQLVAFYRQNANECLRLAEAADDAAVRDEWIRLADAWTRLAIHAADP